ncbi:transglutaminase domain-containing protein [uncultured Microbulbifer sp.]|uniref:transglutaminase-like domain-containing protein n=1 Tax=uncultured Microbulbifer sp. TaxID=348147 RepID=UPI0025D88B78|nr:transglutaminase domain-containing protein [uncultured Microbulbifer sp.]
MITIFQIGCAGNGLKFNYTPVEVDTTYLLQQVKPVSGIARPQPQSQTLLAVSPEMREFVNSIDPTASPNRRFRKILRTLKLENFQLEYDLGHTTNAAEAFSEQRGNCISFAALIVALAREVGLEANFNRVETRPQRVTVRNTSGREVQQNVLHINAEVSFGWSTQIIEFNFRPRYNYPHTRLSDAAVQALYLNNLALGYATTGEQDKGLSLMREALTLAPGSSTLWNSLGYLYRQHNRLALAESSYNQALNLDRNNEAARQNLKRVYELNDRASLSSSPEVGAQNNNPATGES